MTQFKTESKTIDSKKPQDAKQLALLAQLRKVGGAGGFSSGTRTTWSVS
jgi:hypothetical protein